MSRLIACGADDVSLDPESGLVWTEVGEVEGDDATSATPRRGYLKGLVVDLSEISSAQTVLAQVAREAAGAAALSSRSLSSATQAIGFARDGETDSTTDGVVLWLLEGFPFVLNADQSLHVGLQIDGGTATAKIRLLIETEGR